MYVDLSLGQVVVSRGSDIYLQECIYACMYVCMYVDLSLGQEVVGRGSDTCLFVCVCVCVCVHV